jgi:hypothetical protein
VVLVLGGLAALGAVVGVRRLRQARRGVEQ